MVKDQLAECAINNVYLYIINNRTTTKLKRFVIVVEVAMFMIITLCG